jgi:tetratricopeptide (TPR) repeat protein
LSLLRTLCLFMCLANFGGNARAQGVGATLTELRAHDEGGAKLSVELRLVAVERLGNKSLGLLNTDKRAAGLAKRVRFDVHAGVRAAALKALGSMEGENAPKQLAWLVAELPKEEAADAAKRLAESPAGGEWLVDLLRYALTPIGAQSRNEGIPDGLRLRDLASGRLGDLTLATLLEGLPRALVTTGTANANVVLSLAKRHHSALVRDAASGALDGSIARLGARARDTEVIALFDDLGGSGWDADELLVRKTIYQIGRGIHLDDALESARLVVRRAHGRADYIARRWRFFGCYLEAAAQLAIGRPDEAFEPLLLASLALDGLTMERLDMVPDLRRPSVVFARRGAELLELRGLVDLMAATCLLARGHGAIDPEVIGHLRSAHEFSLWAQLREASVDTSAAISGIDVVLDNELGPRRLVFSAPENPNWSGPGRWRSLDLLLDLGRACRIVVGSELPGFRVPEGATTKAGPREDPRRFQLLKSLRLAQLLAVQRALESTWDPTEMQNLEIQRQALAAAVERDRDEGWNNLDGMRLPSIFALLLAGDLRAEDRGEDAVVLCETLLEDLGNGGSLEQGAWGAWLAARVQIALGGSLSDAGRPRQAMTVLEEAVLGLEAVENTLEERKQGERDERILAIHDAQLKQTRGLRSEALVALAVTSNVRLGNPESALAYFERAYALQQTDFMKGLLACYRARFGAEDEARALLRTIEPAPAVYYNLACAHALLGDVDEALGMLHRELEENHFSPGSLARQKRWAEGDPDLASLWEDPRFLSLVSE